MKLLKRVIRYLPYAVLAALLVLPVFNSIYAQSGKWVNDYPVGRKETNQNDSVNKPSYVHSTVIDNMSSFVEQTSGAVPGVTVLMNETDLAYIERMNNRSALRQTSNMIIAMFQHPPVNLALFIKDTGQTLGFIPRNANAQGIGFSGLSAILPIWKMFRNIAYVFLALVMVVIGFMIMFRKKIDPKTVVSVQNSLPRIIITLILITFSYAIVGLCIDIMYFLILLMVSVFKDFLPDLGSITKLMGYDTPESLYSTGGLFANFSNIDINVWHLFGKSYEGWEAALASFAVTIAGAGLLGGLVTLTGGGALAVAPGLLLLLSIPLVTFLISIALLVLFIRLFVFFVSAYIQIILSVIFSPLQLVVGAIPGNEAFSNWFKNVIANISVFVVGAAGFMLSAIFSKFAADNTGNIWAPPYASLLSNVTAISAVISLGILFMIPTFANQIKEMLKVKSATPGGGAFGMIAGVGQMAFGYFTQKAAYERAMKTQGGQPQRDKPFVGTGGGGGGGKDPNH